MLVLVEPLLKGGMSGVTADSNKLVTCKPSRGFMLFFPFVVYLPLTSHMFLSHDLPVSQSVSRISQSKSIFSQSGNSRDVLPIPFNQSQTSAPHTR